MTVRWRENCYFAIIKRRLRSFAIPQMGFARLPFSNATHRQNALEQYMYCILILNFFSLFPFPFYPSPIPLEPYPFAQKRERRRGRR